MIPRLVDTQVAILTTVDYDGIQRNSGGDPITVKLIGPLETTQQETTITNLGYQQGNNSDDFMRVVDHQNGQYTIHLRYSICGRYINYNMLLKKFMVLSK